MLPLQKITGASEKEQANDVTTEDQMSIQMQATDLKNTRNLTAPKFKKEEARLHYRHQMRCPHPDEATVNRPQEISAMESRQGAQDGFKWRSMRISDMTIKRPIVKRHSSTMKRSFVFIVGYFEETLKEGHLCCLHERQSLYAAVDLSGSHHIPTAVASDAFESTFFLVVAVAHL